MWIMLMQMTAAALLSGQLVSAASSCSGGSILPRPSSAPPCRDTAKRGIAGIGRPKRQVRQVPREVHHMLAAAAGDFEHDAALRQRRAEYIQNRVAVAERR